MATVFVAEDLRQRRRVAVKILRPDVALALGSQRFLSEIEIASRLTHPHILPVHDSGEDAGVLYYVMPYVEGESLREKLNRVGPLPVEEALAIAREIADALAYAHDLDVVHRDIKPGNVLLLAGHAVVADFGVARAISAAADERVTSAGFIVGTPVYMSPEQAAGDEPRRPHRRVRAGLRGVRDAHRDAAVSRRDAAGGLRAASLPRDRAPCASSAPKCRLPAAEAIERALGKLPEDRFADAREFADALRAPVQWEPASRPARNIRRVALAAVLAVAARPGPPRGSPLARRPCRRRPPFSSCRSTETRPRRRRGLWRRRTRASPSSSAGCRACAAARAEGLPPGGRRWADIPLPELLAWGREQGGRYLLAGELLPEGTGRRVTVDLYATETGERLSHAVDTADGRRRRRAVGRLAADVVRTVARREGLELGVGRRRPRRAPTCCPAIGHMLQAQAEVLGQRPDGAASELRAAVEADSDCGLAYQRLSEAERLAPRLSGRARRGRRRAFGARTGWRPAGCSSSGRSATWCSATATAPSPPTRAPCSTSATTSTAGSAWANRWFTTARFSGASPRDARPAFERMAALDSTFAPIYYHLVDLAVYAGDSAAAATFLRRDPARSSVPCRARSPRSGSGSARRRERAAALEALRLRRPPGDQRGGDRLGPRRVRPGAGGHRGGLPAGRRPPARRPPARRAVPARDPRGAGPLGRGLRGLGLGGRGRSPSIPGWCRRCWPGIRRAPAPAPMFEWARAQVRAGRTPDFTLVPWDDLRQGVRGAGLSRRGRGRRRPRPASCCSRIDRRAAAAPSEPAADALRWSLRARLALLAATPPAPSTALPRAVARIPEPHTANYPLTAARPAALPARPAAAARGDSAGAARWRRSFAGRGPSPTCSISLRSTRSARPLTAPGVQP